MTPTPLLSEIVLSRTSIVAVLPDVGGATTRPVVPPLIVEKWTVPTVPSRKSSPVPLRPKSVFSTLTVSVPELALNTAPVPLSRKVEFVTWTLLVAPTLAESPAVGKFVTMTLST